jgi:pimeloyl-ACP methyl ester carboxylesterase
VEVVRRRVLLLVVLACVSLGGSGCAFNLLFTSPSGPDEKLRAPTADGWDLALYHYRPAKARPDKAPVILCHGMALNNYFWNLTVENHFPRFLTDRGYDVWTVDLRGYGQSRLHERYQGYSGFDLQRHDPTRWTVDDYVRFDLPAILATVCERTGAEGVTWVGHSMGGMVMYGYLATAEDTGKVKEFVAVGAPVFIPQPPNDILRNMEESEGLLNVLLAINVRGPARTIAPAAWMFNTPLAILYYNAQNMEWATIVRMYANAFEDIPPGVSAQMMRMVRSGEFQSADGSLVYAKMLDKVQCPVLLLCAKGDNLATEWAVVEAYQRVGSADKSYRLFGVANGCAADYGHCDVINGKRARQEVFTYIADWLDRH